MGFFKSRKDKISDKDGQQLHQARYASDKQQTHQHSSKSSAANANNHVTVSPQQKPFDSFQGDSESYLPPPGPPPSHSATNSNTNPPPYESWLSIPDASQLPPPPIISYDLSPSNNASYYSAEMGHAWCAKHPVYTPSRPQHPSILRASEQGELGLDPPPQGFKGAIHQLDSRSWQIRTEKKQEDMILISMLPAYFAAVSNPLLQQQSPQIPTASSISISASIEIATLSPSAGIALGFASKPYPPFRLPGWHRASLALHSDDGHRYVNDPWGGLDFTRPFRAGDTIKLTMTLHQRLSPVQQYRGHVQDVRRVGGGLPKCAVQVQFERNGRYEGSWDVHEERDGEKDEGIEGLQGEADLYVAVGIFGATEFVLRYNGN